MIYKFEILKLFDHHNRGQFIVCRQSNFEELVNVKEGALLKGIPVYHYTEMYPITDEHGQPRPDVYVLRPVLERFPDGHFEEGQIVDLLNPY
ncbi:MAG: hypothetical protein WCF67_15315 [Chitinophagaceae bacterium]